MNNLTHKSGWMGGQFYLNDEPFSFKDKPQGWITIDEEYVFRLEYGTTTGADFDHGASQHWVRTEPGIIDGTISPRFLSVLEMGDRDIYIELDNHDH